MWQSKLAARQLPYYRSNGKERSGSTKIFGGKVMVVVILEIDEYAKVDR